MEKNHIIHKGGLKQGKDAKIRENSGCIFTLGKNGKERLTQKDQAQKTVAKEKMFQHGGKKKTLLKGFGEKKVGVIKELQAREIRE